jgi:transcriptional regulator GlxA family with amidase domain
MSFIQIAHRQRGASPGPLPTDTEQDAPRRLSRFELVARVNGFLRDNISEPITVTELSRIAGVSERTLRAAFHDVVGISPKQYVIGERLRAARQALCAANPETTTVTDIAMEYGFFELGRFAGRYRHAFGETPSRTLRHAAASWPMQAA